MSFAMTQEWKCPLLRPRLVRSDVYIQGLTQDELQMIHEALGKGLTPSGFDAAARDNQRRKRCLVTVLR
jgi:hypothetical protein